MRNHKSVVIGATIGLVIGGTVTFAAMASIQKIAALETRIDNLTNNVVATRESASNIASGQQSRINRSQITTSIRPQNQQYDTSPQNVLSNKDAVNAIFSSLATLTTIKTEAPNAPEKIQNLRVFAFIDPECPFSRNAAAALVGKIPIYWLPVAVLNQSEAVLGKLENFYLTAKTDPAAAITSFAHEKLSQSKISQHTRTAIMENSASFGAIAQAVDTVQGVPLIILESADGTAELLTGFQQGDEEKILSLLL